MALFLPCTREMDLGFEQLVDQKKSPPRALSALEGHVCYLVFGLELFYLLFFAR